MTKRTKTLALFVIYCCPHTAVVWERELRQRWLLFVRIVEYFPEFNLTEQQSPEIWLYSTRVECETVALNRKIRELPHLLTQNRQSEKACPCPCNKSDKDVLLFESSEQKVFLMVEADRRGDKCGDTLSILRNVDCTSSVCYVSHSYLDPRRSCTWAVRGASWRARARACAHAPRRPYRVARAGDLYPDPWRLLPSFPMLCGTERLRWKLWHARR